jgi:putative heme iron utilization protein
MAVRVAPYEHQAEQTDLLIEPGGVPSAVEGVVQKAADILCDLPCRCKSVLPCKRVQRLLEHPQIPVPHDAAVP